MKNSLSIRFLVIILAVLSAALIVWSIPPKLGIDLAGGTSLLYELDLSNTAGQQSGIVGGPGDACDRGA